MLEVITVTTILIFETEKTISSIVFMYNGLCMGRVWVRRGGCIGSWWGNRREGDHLGDLGVDGWIILG